MKTSKNLVKNLRGKIKELEKEKDRYYTDYLDQRIETEKKEEIIKCLKEFRNGMVNELEVNFQGEIRRLQEIIKWLIKPSTTEEKRLEKLNRPFFGDGRP